MNAEGYFNRGMAYLKSEDWDKATGDFEEALKLLPEGAESDAPRKQIFEKLGDAYFKRGYYTGSETSSIKFYTRAIRYKSLVGLIAIGSLANRSKRYFLRATDAEGSKSRSSAANKDDLSLAIADIEHAIRESPQEASYYKALDEAKSAGGAPFKDRGKDYQTIAELTEAISVSPNDAEAYFKRGMAFNNCKNFEQAVEDIDTARELDPQNAQYTAASDKAGSANFKRKAISFFIKVGVVAVIIIVLVHACS